MDYLFKHYLCFDISILIESEIVKNFYSTTKHLKFSLELNKMPNLIRKFVKVDKLKKLAIVL